MAETLITPEFRGSYVTLVEPRPPAEGQKPVYSMVIVIPKSETEFLEKLETAIEEAAKAKFGKIPAKLKSTLRDGDDEEKEEFKDCILFSVKSATRPGVVDADLQPIIDPEELYSGAYYRASINPFAWDHPTGGKGVSFGLNNVMKVRDGEPFSGRKAAEEDFKAFA